MSSNYRVGLLIFFVGSFAYGFSNGNSQPLNPAAYGKMPLTFEWRGDSVWQPVVAHVAGRTVAFAASGAVMDSAGLMLQFPGSRPAVLPRKDGPQVGIANYFTGSNPDQWRTGVPLFQAIRYSSLYPGVDLVYHGNQNRLEYDLIVAPGASWQSIRLAFGGAEPVEIDSEGNLKVPTESGWVTHARPAVYQITQEGRRAVPARYVLNGAHEAGFEIGAYDPRQALVIDPTLAFASYLGGSGDDYGHAVAVDSSGCTYVVGETGSFNFPSVGPEQSSMAGNTDVFITKWKAAGTGLVYSTYIGGNNRDAAMGVAVDAAGNAYVTGFTYSANFPITSGALRTSFMGTSKAFVLKLNPAGSGLVYSTFLGGSGADYGSGIAVDASGEAHIAGYTASVDFPVTAGAFQPAYGGGAYDGFLAKLNQAGSALLFATYLGGLGNDTAAGVALDPSANIYVTGQTQSGNFPTLNPLQPTGSESDAFVVKMNSSGQVTYSTFLGGTGLNNGTGIAADASGNAYVTGFTNAPDFPGTSTGYQSFNKGSYDAFVAIINTYGSGVTTATYLGGSGSDIGYGIALDGSGNVLIAGSTSSIDFPVSNAVQSSYSGGGDGFVAAFNNQLTSLLYATYYGGSGADVAAGIAADSAGDAYVTGWTGSGGSTLGLLIPPGAFQPTGLGGIDAFVAKLAVSGGPLACTSSAAQVVSVPAGSPAQQVGDLLLTCAGGTSGTQATANLQIALNTTLATSQPELFVGSNTTPIWGAASGTSGILFQWISFTAPGSSGSVTLRITNVWANLASMAPGGQVLMTVSVPASSPALSVTPAQQAVAAVQNIPETQLQQLVFAKSPVSPGCTPPPAAAGFFTSDTAAIAWFELSNTTIGGVARVDWSAPWGPVYQSHSFTAVNGGTQCFTDTMNIAGAPLPMAGAWNADIYWNNARLSAAPFNVSKPSTFQSGGKAEYAVWQPSNGGWYVTPYGNSGPTTGSVWGVVGDVPVPADYDGDGIIDYAIWRPSTGVWWIIPSSNPSKIIMSQWGVYGDVPVPRDYDGDGKADLAVWRPSIATWYIIPSSTSQPYSTAWGSIGDIPVPADYDGDGKADLAVWQPSNGTWYISPSSNPSKPIITQWGVLGDIPAPADYDGDGKADLAVWYPPTGTWSIIPSATPSQPIVKQLGLLGDIPVPKDYDGDGKADISIWRPGTATFWVIPSSNPAVTQSQQLGAWGDVPVYLPEGSLSQTYHP